MANNETSGVYYCSECGASISYTVDLSASFVLDCSECDTFHAFEVSDLDGVVTHAVL